MNIEQVVSAIQNDIISGLPGHSNHSRFSLEQIEDDLIDERLAVIKEYSAKLLLPIKELLINISCIPIGCKDMTGCCGDVNVKPSMHFEIPQVITDFGIEGIDFIGSVDMQIPFKVYTNHAFRRHKFRRRGANKPYVWVNTTPNENAMFDCFVFNAPMLKQITAVIAPKDPRQLEQFSCCNTQFFDSKSFLDVEIKRRVTEKYIRYYRQMATAVSPNTQIAT